MKRKTKISKLVSGTMAFVCLLMMMITPVNAMDDVEVDKRGAVCVECNNGQVVERYGNWSSWYRVGDVPCAHYPYGTDLIEERSAIVNYVCNYCGAINGSRTATERRTTCHGYH